MATRLVNVDRNTPMLLSLDLRDWIGKGDLGHSVIEAVDRFPLEIFQINHRGSGDEQFPTRLTGAVANSRFFGFGLPFLMI